MRTQRSPCAPGTLPARSWHVSEGSSGGTSYSDPTIPLRSWHAPNLAGGTEAEAGGTEAEGAEPEATKFGFVSRADPPPVQPERWFLCACGRRGLIKRTILIMTPF